MFPPAVLGDSALKYMFILENQKSNPAGLTKASNKEYILAMRYEAANGLKRVNLQISHWALKRQFAKTLVDMFLTSEGLPVENPNNTQPFSRALMTSEYNNRDNRMRYFLMIPGYPYWQQLANYHINWDWSPADLAIARFHDPWWDDFTGYNSQQYNVEREVPNWWESPDYPTIRLAEVYLNFAEAKFERNEAISDADLDKSLNLVRLRVNKTMPKLSNSFVAANGLDMRTEIRRERAIGAVKEGFRFDDLKRWYTAHIEFKKPILGVKYTGTEFQTRYPTLKVSLNSDGYVVAEPVSRRQFALRNYLFPLPTQELALNPNLEQNPEW